MLGLRLNPSQLSRLRDGKYFAIEDRKPHPAESDVMKLAIFDYHVLEGVQCTCTCMSR
jgi:hypothetical protein